MYAYIITHRVVHHADAASSGSGGGGCKKDSKNIGEYVGGVQLQGMLEERYKTSQKSMS
jgi:hypothetical protein